MTSVPKKYLLDTDVFSYLVANRHPEARRKAMRHKESISLSVVTMAEALFGARKRESKKLESIVGLFMEMFPVVEWTAAAASAYADIRVALERQGEPIGEMDMMIAASALAGGYVLVTNNMRHFRRVPELKIENWVNGK